jgi:predicted acylesterase/phospholipase RssA
MLRQKGIDIKITFKQLYDKTQKELVLTGYNVSTGMTECFDHLTHPNMEVLLAIRITMCIPMIFRPIIYNNQMYIDGSFVEPVPIRFCKRKKNSLIITLLSSTLPSEDSDAVSSITLQTYFDLLFKGVYSVLSQRCLRLKTKYPDNFLIIDLSNYIAIDYKMTTVTKAHLYQVGRSHAQKWVRSLSG